MTDSVFFANRLRHVFAYDPQTGVFTRQISTSHRVNVGDIAGSPGSHGYLQIMVDGRLYLAHRLAWLYMYGEWPKLFIDHIDGDKKNNRIANLRDVNRTVNSQNRRKAQPRSQSKLIGACFHERSGRWQSQIRVGGKRQHLGWHDSPEAAHDAYVMAKRRLHEGCTI